MSSLAELRQRIQLLSDAVVRQREVLRDLEQQHSAAQGELNYILDPMTRLPLEISSDILLQSVPNPPSLATLSVFPRVSRAWRAISLATPALWTGISDAGIPPSKFPKVLGLWLARGRGSPISLSLCDLDTDTVAATFAALKDDAERVEKLDIFAGGALSTFRLPHYPFVGLKSITLDTSYEGLKFSSKWVLNMLRDAPLLVECNLLYTDFDPSNAEKLTHLTLRRLRLGPHGLNSGHRLLQHLTLPSLEAFSSSMAIGDVHALHSAPA
ncbi:hypothetical protein FB45DRAFT_1012893 [Roridomyces roridus]|uniref:F-box domain-containing protein n=1 Tax=Roridomyces roridus TaxID=1738132 RepID=A0AAD7AZN8_9AGAR|nr:hypothetical protein FB45DRAFT_1012893 [Roridomyces roridus]